MMGRKILRPKEIRDAIIKVCLEERDAFRGLPEDDATMVVPYDPYIRDLLKWDRETLLQDGMGGWYPDPGAIATVFGYPIRISYTAKELALTLTKNLAEEDLLPKTERLEFPF